MTWTIDFVEQQAPDTASVKAGYKQANVAKWIGLSKCDSNGLGSVLWGEIKGSGSKAYRTQIDLNGPAFKCSCPSRKFPCKHGIGLGLVYANTATAFTEQSMPEWVESWINKRRERAQKKSGKPTNEADPTKNLESHDSSNLSQSPLSAEELEALQKKAKAKAKRLENRKQKVTQGLIDLELRLQDLLRNGLISIKEPYSYWEQVGARLVDAQASALAKRVRLIPVDAQTPQAQLQELAYLNLICVAWRQRDNLSDHELADLKTAIGFSSSQDELMQKEGLSDHWLLCGVQKEQEQQLSVLKQWLYGVESGQLKLHLSYAFYNQAHPYHFHYSQLFNAELCSYDGFQNQRVVIKAHQLLDKEQQAQLASSDLAHHKDCILNHQHQDLRGFTCLNDLLLMHAQHLAAQPWSSQRAYLLKNLLLCEAQDSVFAYDQANTNAYYQVSLSKEAVWQILATTGGMPAHYATLWDSQKKKLTLLSLFYNGEIYPLT